MVMNQYAHHLLLLRERFPGNKSTVIHVEVHKTAP